MKISAIRSAVASAINTKRNNDELKFLDKYCRLNDNLSNEVYSTLNPVRKMIANYAKSKGVSVEISDAEKKVSKIFFESDVDERIITRAASGKLDITLTDLQPRKRKGNAIPQSLTEYIPNDIKAKRIHKIPDYIVVADEGEGIEWVRLTSHQYEDGFLGMVFRTISQLAENLTKKS